MTKDQEITTLRRTVDELQQLLSLPVAPGEMCLDVRFVGPDGNTAHLQKTFYMNQMDTSMKRRTEFMNFFQAFEEHVFGQPQIIITDK